MTRIDCAGISDDASAAPQIKSACDGFIRDGYAILDHVLAPAKAHALHAEFNSRYARYLRDVEHEDSMQVGDKRYRIPVEFSGGFADPDIYANSAVTALIRATLGGDAIIEAYGAVISLAGAEAQHVHRDSPFLFDATIAPLLPCHAITLALPLVDMDDVHGTTALWPGSHRWRTRDEQVLPSRFPIPAGSCLLWDFRLYHAGMPNRSDRPRPMIYATYARRWYRDPNSFTRRAQVRLAFGSGFLPSVPEDRRSLFAHVA